MLPPAKNLKKWARVLKLDEGELRRMVRSYRTVRIPEDVPRPYAAVGRYIREKRGERSVQDIINRVPKLTRGELQKMEGGLVNIPPNKIDSLAKALGAPKEELASLAKSHAGRGRMS